MPLGLGKDSRFESLQVAYFFYFFIFFLGGGGGMIFVVVVKRDRLRPPFLNKIKNILVSLLSDCRIISNNHLNIVPKA